MSWRGPGSRGQGAASLARTRTTKGKRGVASLGQADAGLTATSASAPPPPSTAGAAREMDRVQSVMMSSTSPKGGMVNSLVKYKDKY